MTDRPNESTSNSALDVVYNDTCPICAREVALYQQKTDDDVVYHGLSKADLAEFGLTEDQAAREFHVRHNGELVSGLAAFALLWERMPRLRWLAWLVRAPIMGPIAEWIYRHILARALYTMHKRRVARRAASHHARKDAPDRRKADVQH